MVAEVNPDALEGHKGLIANPNCSTMQLMVALKPIHDAAGIERLIVSTYQSVSGTGVKAVDELEDQTHAALHGEPLPRADDLPAPIAFNVLGGAGNFADGDDHTDEERKMMFETRKILGDESIAIAVTCARVPVRNSHSESVTLQTRDAALASSGRASCSGPCPGSTWSTTRRRHAYPTALGAAGPRRGVRRPPAPRPVARARRCSMWVVSDNLLKGAATNAVQIAEVLHDARAGAETPDTAQV